MRERQRLDVTTKCVRVERGRVLGRTILLKKHANCPPRHSDPAWPGPSLVRWSQTTQKAARGCEVSLEPWRVVEPKDTRLPPFVGETQLIDGRGAHLICGRYDHARMRTDFDTELSWRQVFPLVHRDVVPYLFLHKGQVAEATRKVGRSPEPGQ